MQPPRPLSVVAALAAALLAMPAAAAPDDAAAVIAAAKAAAGGSAWDRLGGWDETGVHGGASYETKIDPHGYGLVTTTIRNGATVAGGYNGVVAWSTDPDGKTQIFSDPAQLADARGTAYGGVYAFFLPDRFPAAFSYLGEKRADGGDFDVVRIQPTASKPMDIWVDRATHLVARTVDNSGPVPLTVRLSDFRTVDGVKVPFHQVMSAGDPASDQTLDVTSIQTAPIPRAAFDPPTGR
jgi:hypothetical protein